MAYRARIVAGEPAANGDTHLDCFIETDVTGDWVLVPGGHKTVVLGFAEVVAVVDDPVMTDPQKRQALLALFRLKVVEFGIVDADYAYEGMYALLPGGWPVTVDVEPT